MYVRVLKGRTILTKSHNAPRFCRLNSFVLSCHWNALDCVSGREFNLIQLQIYMAPDAENKSEVL